MIFLNIVSGIIIDTFSTLRDELTERNYDRKNICHICGMNRFSVQKLNNDFKVHREFNHDVWAYVWFLVGLKGNKFKNFTSVEYYVH